MSELLLKDRLTEIREVIDSGLPTLVEFGADWCMPCHAFLPHFTKFAERHPEIQCVKVDVAVDESVLSEFNISSVPQLMLFLNGEFDSHVKGRRLLNLEQELSQHLSN